MNERKQGSKTASKVAAASKVIHPNGMTEEQVEYTLAALGRRKNDTDYLKVWEEGLAELRQRDKDTLERELTEEGK